MKKPWTDFFNTLLDQINSELRTLPHARNQAWGFFWKFYLLNSLEGPDAKAQAARPVFRTLKKKRLSRKDAKSAFDLCQASILTTSL